MNVDKRGESRQKMSGGRRGWRPGGSGRAGARSRRVLPAAAAMLPRVPAAPLGASRSSAAGARRRRVRETRVDGAARSGEARW